VISLDWPTYPILTFPEASRVAVHLLNRPEEKPPGKRYSFPPDLFFAHFLVDFLRQTDKLSPGFCLPQVETQIDQAGIGLAGVCFIGYPIWI
jgi:hypothetical protein